MFSGLHIHIHIQISTTSPSDKHHFSHSSDSGKALKPIWLCKKDGEDAGSIIAGPATFRDRIWRSQQPRCGKRKGPRIPWFVTRSIPSKFSALGFICFMGLLPFRHPPNRIYRSSTKFIGSRMIQTRVIYNHHSLCKCFTSNSDEDDWGVNTHFISKSSKYDRFQKFLPGFDDILSLEQNLKYIMPSDLCHMCIHLP